MDQKQLLRIREIALRLGLEPPKNPEEFLKKANEQSAYSPVSTESKRYESDVNQTTIQKEKFIIEHGRKIGLIQFQMSKEDVNRCLDIYRKQYNDEVATSFFCEYDENGHVYAIHLTIKYLKNYFECEFKGIDIFQTKAKDMIVHFEQLEPYVRNNESKFGFTYVFPTLGITFWRGNVCNEEDLEADWFKELHPDIQEDEKRFLFFETVTFYKMNNFIE